MWNLRRLLIRPIDPIYPLFVISLDEPCAILEAILL